MDLKSAKASPVLTDPGMQSLMPCSGPSFPGTTIRTAPKKKPAKIDDVRSNGWLDAMRDSSPRKKKHKDFASDDDFAYRTWMNEYPSALSSFEQIMKRAKHSKIVMFLDYDGVLSPIVDDPDLAFMSSEMRSAVKSVAKYIPTAIISGRSRDKVFELVGLTELYCAGSHGMDIMFPDREKMSLDHLSCSKSSDKEGKDINIFQPAREFSPMIDEVCRTLVDKAKDVKGAKVENHKFCASVHYRNVDENSWPVIAQNVHDVLKNFPRLQLTHGRKVFDIRPIIDWHKGKAVEFLLESLGFGDSDQQVLPIYIGDDRTDEDAFKVLRDGNRGFGILVSSVPKESNAFFSLKDTSEVQQFLKSLASMKEREA